MPATQTPFWRNTPLAQLSPRQWEQLCDHCGRCCLAKLEDEDTGEVFFTDIACRLLDLDSCRCRDYRNRQQKVSDCLRLSMETPEYFNALPDSCAYRRLYFGLDLLPWHPLISGNPDSVHLAGISVRNRCISELAASDADLEEHIIEFDDIDVSENQL